MLRRCHTHARLMKWIWVQTSCPLGGKDAACSILMEERGNGTFHIRRLGFCVVKMASSLQEKRLYFWFSTEERWLEALLTRLLILNELDTSEGWRAAGKEGLLKDLQVFSGYLVVQVLSDLISACSRLTLVVCRLRGIEDLTAKVWNWPLSLMTLIKVISSSRLLRGSWGMEPVWRNQA